MDAIEEKPELITPGEASKDLTISLPTLRKLGETGVLTQIKFSSKSIRYRRDEVNRLRAGGVAAMQTK